MVPWLWCYEFGFEKISYSLMQEKELISKVPDPRTKYCMQQRDGYDATGFYNMDCPSFTLADGAIIAPGDAIHQVSYVPNVPIQNITLRVLKVRVLSFLYA
jgi:hypothetical protein